MLSKTIDEYVDLLLDMPCFKKADQLLSWNQLEEELHQAQEYKDTNRFHEYVDLVHSQTNETKLTIRSRINNHIDKLNYTRNELASYVCSVCLLNRWAKLEEGMFSADTLKEIIKQLDSEDTPLYKTSKYSFLCQSWTPANSQHAN